MPAVAPTASVQPLVAAAKARLLEIEGSWKRIQDEWTKLDTEKKALLSVLGMYGASTTAPDDLAPLSGVTAMKQPLPQRFYEMGMTEGVQEYVKLHPGSTPAEVMDALENVVVSTSVGPAKRKAISWMITNLVNDKKRLRRDDKLRLYMNEGVNP